MHEELQSRGIGAELASILEDMVEKRGCDFIEVMTMGCGLMRSGSTSIEVLWRRICVLQRFWHREASGKAIAHGSAASPPVFYQRKKHHHKDAAEEEPDAGMGSEHLREIDR